MRTWKKVVLATVIVFAASGAGAAVAIQATGPGDPPATAGDGAPASAAADLGNGITESKFIPVTPCRLADTRLGGGPVAKDATRNFEVRGTTGFPAQGGKSGGCGIPTGATAVEISVTSVDAAGGGYMRVYPFGVSEPTATFLNYGVGNPTNTGTVKLCTSGCTFDLKATAHSNATDVVIDVQGYYAKPMAAHINDDGTVVSSSRLTGVEHNATGVYRMAWDRPVTGCVAVASPYFNDSDVTAVQTENANSILVVTKTRGTEASSNTDFVVEVIC